MDYGRFNHRKLGILARILCRNVSGNNRKASRAIKKQKEVGKMKELKIEQQHFKLKMQMEIVRTVCPVIAIILQIIVIVKIF